MKIFKQNPIKSYRDFRQGMKKLTPLDYLRAKKQGHLWGIIGLALAGTVMAYRGYWYFLIFIGAMAWLQMLEYKITKEKYEGLEAMLRKETILTKSEVK